MRIKIRHETDFSFEPAARSVIQILRLSPRNHEGQHVVFWRIDLDVDCRLSTADDAFGNITHAFDMEEPLSHFTLVAEGEVQTFDTAGVVRGAVERFPPELYLRSTPATAADDLIRTFAMDTAGQGGDALGRIHRLMRAVHERLTPEAAAAPWLKGSAAEAFAVGRGGAADFANVLIAGARALEIPARFVSGYVEEAGGIVRDAMHAWTEVFVPGLGWVGFDAMQCVCPSESHVRVASALDALGAAPIRSSPGPGGPAVERSRLEVADLQAGVQQQG